MNEFEFGVGDEELANFFRKILLEMETLFGISHEEALGRMNNHWRGMVFTDNCAFWFYRESPDFWARRIYYKYNWWGPKARFEPKPYP